MTARQDVVLVVDGDLAVREALKFTLEIEGFTVYLCATGPELLAHSKLPRADCLILDDKMPLMEGVSVLDRLVEGNFTVPIILITDHVTDNLRRRAAVARVRHILEKPLLNGALIDNIHAVLGHIVT